MASKGGKDVLYAQQLDAARLRGDWESPVPVAAAAGGKAPISWQELIRKYMKHNPNSTVTPSVAQVEQQMRATLAAYQRDLGAYSDASHDKDLALPDGSGRTAFPTPMPHDQFGNGWRGPEVVQAASRLEELAASARSSRTDAITVQGIAALRAYAAFSLGNDEAAIGLLHQARYFEDVELEKIKAAREQDYSVALLLLGFCVYGMANERLYAAKKDDAFKPFVLAGYARAIDLHEGVRGGKRADALRGLAPDEIECWGETALYRNALFSVRTGNIALGLDSLRAYQAHVGRWPTSFRGPQRNVIYRTYLAVLTRAVEAGGFTDPPRSTGVRGDEDWRSASYQRSVIDCVASRVRIRDFEAERAPRHGQARRMLGAAATGITSRTTSKRRPAAHRALRPASANWSNEMLTVQHAAAAAILRSEQFPRAGHVNIAAIQLADDLVRAWQLNGELGGAHADDVVEILYNLAKITFHSQRISRHLFTLLVAAEAYDEARMALELYAQIFEKAKEGDAADSAALVEEGRRRKEADAIAEENGVDAPEHGGISDEAKRASQEVTTDQDDDGIYVATLLHGAHVVGRFLHDIHGADALARKAYDAHLANPKLSSDRSLSARAKRIAGSARAALAARESDATKRAALQDEALSLLKQSATLDDQSSETFYQLAYLQAEMRDSTTAVRSARLALELEPADVQCWHLLALLRSAQKDFKGALRIAEEGLAEAEEDDEADLKAILRASSANGINGTSKTSMARTVLLSVDFPPTYAERAEALLRLHMTHSALEEVVSGTEAAIAAQRDVFSFFQKRVATTAVLPLGAGGAAGSAPPPTKHGKLSTLLGGSAAIPPRFGSLSGMGLSGATHHHSEEAHRGASLLPHLHRRRASQKVEEAPMPAGTSGASNAEAAHDAQDDGEASTAMQQREARRAKHEAHLLASLWLQSAASFRRAHQLSQARAAVQEAERLDSSRAEVWVQLALYFEAQQQWELAVQSLYKALACESECVPAVVNLARLFLQHPDLSPAASAAPTSETLKDRKLPSAVTDALAVPSPFGSEGAAASATQAKPTELGAIALAEGLLRASTASAAWDCASAWLFLAQTARRTGRLAQSRTFLEYALELEKTETVRPLGAALFRS